MARSISASYQRREPEDTILHTTVREHVETFCARASRSGHTLPRFVERELRGYLECGILAHGFLRVRCEACGLDRLVAFSCKGRGFCPSCGARRMAELAAHLSDRVFPRVPVRQWVLSLPFPLRYRLAYDSELTAEVLRLVTRQIFSSLRRRARRRYQTDTRAYTGGVTFVQRFGDALNLNLHFHCLLLDGVYERRACGPGRFFPLPAPEPEELQRVVRRIAGGLVRLLERRGVGSQFDPELADPLAGKDPLLARLYEASLRGRVATGPRAGQPVLRLGDRIDPDDIDEEAERSDCAAAGGLSLHAGVCVPARDRRRLERLCRYAARPPLSMERLSQSEDGRLVYRLRHRWRDGTTHIVLEPIELLERLAALVPPPRFHMVRYHGILAPSADWRSLVVPSPDEHCEATESSGVRTHACPQTAAHAGGQQIESRANLRSQPAEPSSATVEPTSARSTAAQVVAEQAGPGDYSKLSWAELMQRVFALDVLECPRCNGRMKIIAAIRGAKSTRAILEHLGLPSRAPPIAPARREDAAEPNGENAYC